MTTPSPGFAHRAQPGIAQHCMCEQIALSDRDAILVLAERTEDAVATACQTIEHAMSIGWTGRAATLYRQALADSLTSAGLADEALHRIRHAAWTEQQA